MARSHLDTIQERFGDRPFRVREAVAAGIPRQAIYRLRDGGLLASVSRGVMQRADVAICALPASILHPSGPCADCVSSFDIPSCAGRG
jgi:hypothetical protein